MRIKSIVSLALDEAAVQERAAIIPAQRLRPGTEVSFFQVRNGVSEIDSPYSHFLMEIGVFDAGLDTEAQGFDALCIDTIADPALDALRSRLTIPVVGAGQTAFNVACMLGKKFSIIVTSKGWRGAIEKTLAINELDCHLASFRYLDAGIGHSDAESLAVALEAVCRRALDDGADTIILGHPSMEAAESVLGQRLGVPVIAPGICSLKLAEALVNLGLTHSKSAYRSPAIDFDYLMRTRFRSATPRPPAAPVVRSGAGDGGFRIKVVVPVSGMDEAALNLRSAALPPGLLLERTKVDYTGLSDSSDSADCQYDAFLLEVFCFEEAIKAQAEGYNAVLIDSTTDSGMAAIRSRLDILGLGPGQACWNVAGMLGNRFSILAMEDKWTHFYLKNLSVQNLRHKLASVVNIGIAPDPVHLFEGKEKRMNEALSEIGQKAIGSDGADVLVLGSTTMHQATEYLAAALPVPILSPGRVGVRVAEALLELGLTQSAIAFPQPEHPKDEAIFEHHVSAAGPLGGA